MLRGGHSETNLKKILIRATSRGDLSLRVVYAATLEVLQYTMSTVNDADARRASARMQFQDVVKANPSRCLSEKTVCAPTPEVPQYLMSTVNEADAKRAYSARMEFKDVVKTNRG